ncbi:glycosyltransferase family 4 protein [Roseibium sp. RKSG952]|uniref:glycosyltransferase family 4 protein n=1 Tax=Roseibium sp. RKSG952 TaxID=2529384 RepID=UPI0012BC3158|nr:glycosyltransferase family 4 protein [Roseibium sp. RKSG952]MTH94888.1 glycosyltransferase [Roseibium sp. RKSG952]
MAEAAKTYGFDVHVVATLKAGIAPFEKYNGVSYHRVIWNPGELLRSTFPLSIVKSLSRYLATVLVKALVPYLKYKLYCENFIEKVVELKPNVIHAHDLICLPLAIKAAEITGAKVVYDAHELEVHRNPPLSRLQKLWVARVETRNSRAADAVLSVGRYGARELSKMIGRSVDVIYNSPPLDPCRRQIKQDCEIGPDSKLIVYVGKITAGRGISDVISMLPMLPNVYFAAVGPSDPKSMRELEAATERLGVSHRFRALPPVPYRQVVSYISSADVGIISVEPVTLSYQYCMPNKLFEMTFAKIPILSNELDEISEFLNEIGHGRVVDYDNRAGLPLAIYEMLENRDAYKISEEKWQRLSEEYSWESQERKLFNVYRRILS